MNIPSNLRSFIVVCQELGISNIDYFAQNQVRGTSIEEWANYSIDEFTEHQKLLSTKERETLTSHLTQCVDTLPSKKFLQEVSHWKD